MAIVKFSVDPYSKAPARKEYEKETAHYYVWRAKDKGFRRDAKQSPYYRYFDTESEALEFIADRNAKLARSKEIDQIKRHAVELLEALEGILPFIPNTSASEGGAAKHSANVAAADKVRAAIAKAKSPTGNT